MKKPLNDCYKMRKDTGNTESYISIECFSVATFYNASVINGNREEILSVKFNTCDQILLGLKKYLEILKDFLPF